MTLLHVRWSEWLRHFFWLRYWNGGKAEFALLFSKRSLISIVMYFPAFKYPSFTLAGRLIVSILFDGQISWTEQIPYCRRLGRRHCVYLQLESRCYVIQILSRNPQMGVNEHSMLSMRSFSKLPLRDPFSINIRLCFIVVIVICLFCRSSSVLLLFTLLAFSILYVLLGYGVMDKSDSVYNQFHYRCLAVFSNYACL